MKQIFADLPEREENENKSSTTQHSVVRRDSAGLVGQRHRTR
jgi:hypothetical protein